MSEPAQTVIDLSGSTGGFSKEFLKNNPHIFMLLQEGLLSARRAVEKKQFGLFDAYMKLFQKQLVYVQKLQDEYFKKQAELKNATAVERVAGVITRNPDTVAKFESGLRIPIGVLAGIWLSQKDPSALWHNGKAWVLGQTEQSHAEELDSILGPLGIKRSVAEAPAGYLKPILGPLGIEPSVEELKELEEAHLD